MITHWRRKQAAIKEGWAPERHRYFDRRFKARVKTFLLCAGRAGLPDHVAVDMIPFVVATPRHPPVIRGIYAETDQPGDETPPLPKRGKME